ncbi:hypothetical protein GH714_031702 [Hevea brasiliensis]|uniref:AB hydrolase-1 domain-containing protein n=1 Tax=Hevea brasiliensis TaxID=3981 RepID=A0A6A6L4C9_HEVBR|nr:hypothetical protein GH714_031702 [Hevea brasiliensis]
METKKHFILVHGSCHGAWCWYKAVPLLKLAGHNVTALDLGSCGVNPKQLDEVSSIYDYVQPLMEVMASLPPDEKIFLDLKLGKLLVRPTGVFVDELGKDSLLTEAKFGSVSRFFVLCEGDVVMVNCK